MPHLAGRCVARAWGCDRDVMLPSSRYLQRISTPRHLILTTLAAATGLAASLVLLPAPAVAVSTGPRADAGGSRFQIPADADQLIVVDSATYHPARPGYVATLRTYARAGRRSRWRTVFGAWHAEIGYGHLRDVRREGDGSTPTGVFGIGATMYGTKPDPGGLHYAYHRLVCGDWWDEDPYSLRYNRFVHVLCGVTPVFASWSEALWTETRAYRYFAVVQFNANPITAGSDAPGSGIFLHSWVGGATAGCVALPEVRLLAVLRWLRPSAHPVIEIGTEHEVDPAPPR